MADVSATLRSALAQLEAERTRLQKQIAALKTALGERGGARRGRPRGGKRKPSTTRRKRKTMSPAQRRAVSQRMKAYWAERRKKK